MYILDNKQVIFSITVVELQAEARLKIGRELSDDELHIAQKCIESGLSFNLDVVVHTAIDEATRHGA